MGRRSSHSIPRFSAQAIPASLTPIGVGDKVHDQVLMAQSDHITGFQPAGEAAQRAGDGAGKAGEFLSSLPGLVPLGWATHL